MDFSDEDLFPLSGEEDDRDVNNVINSLSVGINNPVKEHLLRQMHDTTERIEKAKSNVDRVKALTEKILRKMDIRETCGVSSESDTESESYQVTGEPVVKKKRIRQREHSQLLEISNVWQRIIDDKWIIGICLKNKSNRILTNPRAYVMLKDETETRGSSSFWDIIDSMSTRTDQLASTQVDKTIATIVLDLPNFAAKDCFEAFGTICYSLDEKDLQTPVPLIRLTTNDVIDNKFSPVLSDDTENTILALKTICVEREIIIPHDKEGIGARLDSFLHDNGFKVIGDEMCDVYIAKGYKFLRHCIFEVLAINDTGAPVRISARTPSQLEVIVRLLRDKFSDLVLEDTDDRLMEAARALERELELELVGDASEALHMARLVTDLLID